MPTINIVISLSTEKGGDKILFTKKNRTCADWWWKYMY